MTKLSFIDKTASNMLRVVSNNPYHNLPKEKVDAIREHFNIEASKEPRSFSSHGKEFRVPPIFNGPKVVAMLNEENIDIIRTDYALELAAKKKIILDTLVPLGAAALCITPDNKIIVGSRDISRDKDDNGSYPIHVAGGGAESDFLLEISPHIHRATNAAESKDYHSLDYRKKFGEDESNYATFAKFLANTALREAREELFDFPDEDIKDLGVAGLLSLDHEDGKKYIIGGLAIFRIKYTYDELLKRRLENQPPDFWEMTIIEGMGIPEMITGMNNKFRFNFDDRIRSTATSYAFTGALSVINESMYTIFRESGKLNIEHLDYTQHRTSLINANKENCRSI